MFANFNNAELGSAYRPVFTHHAIALISRIMSCSSPLNHENQKRNKQLILKNGKMSPS